MKATGWSTKVNNTEKRGKKDNNTEKRGKKR
jgi:hypothetical protein